MAFTLGELLWVAIGGELVDRGKGLYRLCVYW